MTLDGLCDSITVTWCGLARRNTLHWRQLRAAGWLTTRPSVHESLYVLGAVPTMEHFSTRRATRKMHALTEKARDKKTEANLLLWFCQPLGNEKRKDKMSSTQNWTKSSEQPTVLLYSFINQQIHSCFIFITIIVVVAYFCSEPFTWVSRAVLYTKLPEITSKLRTVEVCNRQLANTVTYIYVHMYVHMF